MPSKYTITFNDFGNETSTASFNGTALTAANFDAQLTLIGALRTALEAVTLGNTGKVSIHAVDTDVSSLPAGSAFAQREIKWLVSMVGNDTGKLYQREIPTADLQYLAPNSEEMIAGAVRTALVDAIQDFFEGDGGEAVTVSSIKFVGRKS